VQAAVLLKRHLDRHVGQFQAGRRDHVAQRLEVARRQLGDGLMPEAQFDAGAQPRELVEVLAVEAERVDGAEAGRWREAERLNLRPGARPGVHQAKRARGGQLLAYLADTHAQFLAQLRDRRQVVARLKMVLDDVIQNGGVEAGIRHGDPPAPGARRFCDHSSDQLN